MNEYSRRGVWIQSMTIVLFTIVGIVLGVGYAHRSNDRPSPDVSQTFPIVLHLERISELATTRVHITDILSAEGEGYRGSWLVVGEAILASDLSQVEIIDVNEKERRVRIRLPSPRVVSAHVNHEKTRTWNVERTTWLPWQWGNEGSLRDAAMFHAQQLVETAGAGNEQITAARLHAEQLIRHLLQSADWDIEIEWATETCSS